MEFLLVTVILTLAILGMSIGVIFNRRPLSGSCGVSMNKSLVRFAVEIQLNARNQINISFIIF